MFQIRRDKRIALGRTQGQPVKWGIGYPVFRVGGILTGTEILVTHRQRHFQVAQDGKRQLRKIGSDSPVTADDVFLLTTADPGVTGYLHGGGRVCEVVFALLIANRRGYGTTRQFVPKQRNVEILYRSHFVGMRLVRSANSGACIGCRKK